MEIVRHSPYEHQSDWIILCFFYLFTCLLTGRCAPLTKVFYNKLSWILLTVSKPKLAVTEVAQATLLPLWGKGLSGEQSGSGCFFHTACWWQHGNCGQRGSFFLFVYLSPFLTRSSSLCLSGLFIVMTQKHTTEIRILKIAMLSNYALNPNMNIRILSHILWQSSISLKSLFRTVFSDTAPEEPRKRRVTAEGEKERKVLNDSLFEWPQFNP